MAAKKKSKKKTAPKPVAKTTAKKTTAKKKASKKKTSAKAAIPKVAVAKKVSPVPAGYHTVTPYMNQVDARATIAFCEKAFGAAVHSKMEGPGGKLMHAEVGIGNSIVMLSDEVMEPARVSSIFLYVPDVDKTMARAVKAGATVLLAPHDTFWGDRFGRLKDPFGNLWAVATHIEDVSPKEMGKRMKAEAERMASGSSPSGTPN
jgi:PhnB protein